MPTNIKIIHTQDFIWTKQDGTLDLTSSRNRGTNLKAFTEYETASTWLIMEEQP